MAESLIPLHILRSPGRPEIDLRMAGGRGSIKGRCGIEDDGETFRVAGSHLAQLAQVEGDIAWTLTLELDRVVSTGVRPAQTFIETLAGLVRNRAPHQRTIKVIWRVPTDRESLISMVNSLIERFQEPGFDQVLEKT